MTSLPVILIFDVGKTNKKVLLFDEQYRLVYEESAQFSEITDEDNFPCEDVVALAAWLKTSLNRMLSIKEFNIRAANFSGYGASFVYLDENGKVFLPLYNYLKPFPEHLQKKFYEQYGGVQQFSARTASPMLGNLNSGMQLYRLKFEKTEAFRSIKQALHLPQFLSYVITSKAFTEITSVGCHTNLWDFTRKNYHDWVTSEGIESKFPPIVPADTCVELPYKDKVLCTGIGLHDSSAALIPYQASFHDPFILLSTGTWCISLNPFNDSPLTRDELEKDCLCYLTSQGKPVKASRVFAGHEHEQQLKRLADHFHLSPEKFTQLHFQEVADGYSSSQQISQKLHAENAGDKPFETLALNSFRNFSEAYFHLMLDIMRKQVASTSLVLHDSPVKRLFVDGGFSKNNIYMNLLALAFPEVEVSAASAPQASALGAALIMHKHWNTHSLPGNLVDLQRYSLNVKTV
jgi:sugar (pentulose or hexulose) kinase